MHGSNPISREERFQRQRLEEVAVRIIETGDPEIWEAKSSGHVGLFFFGLPFLLAGLFVMGQPLGLVPVDGDPGPWYMMVPFGSIFALVGLGMMTGRRGILIDRRRHRITKWYGLLIPMVRREHMLGLQDRLVVTREVRKSDKSTRIVYPVRLGGSAQEKAVSIEEPLDYQQARATAESLAGFLRLPLVDRSSGKEVVRESDRLDESLRERARRTDEEIPEVAPPSQMRSALREESGSLIVRIPPTGVTLAHRLQMIGVLIFVGVAVFMLAPFAAIGFEDPASMLLIGLICVGFGLLPVLGVLLQILGQARRGCTVEASRSFLRVEKGRKVAEIFVDELEELAVPDPGLPAGIRKGPDGRFMIDRDAAHRKSGPGRFAQANPGRMTPAGPVLSYVISALYRTKAGPCIMARSDKTTVRFGHGLSREELLYIHAQLKGVLAA